MTHLQNLRLYPVLRWVSSNLSSNSFNSSKNPIFSNNILCNCSYNNYNNVQYNLKFYSMMAAKVIDSNDDIEGSSMSNNGEIVNKIKPTIRKEAQSALLDYLHCTRSLPFLDAEHMSKNSPQFLRRLINNVGYETDMRRSMTRFLRYHPINEFEPFFESIGLDPCEFVPLLPRDLMFLIDEDVLFHNYCVLCEYGVARNDVGKIYRGAREVFRYGHGVLMSKLRGFEELGISKPVIAKAVRFNPSVLIGDVDMEFFKVIRRLQCLGCEYDWVEQNLLKNVSYNWRQIFELLHVLGDLVCNKELGYLVRRHPDFLFDCSGQKAFSLIVFLLKFGSTKSDISSTLLQFPQSKVGEFVWNLGRAFELLHEIEMDAMSIGSIIRTHAVMLGSRSLKKANSILSNLNTGKRRLCDYIIANPVQLKNWGLRSKIERLPGTRSSRARKEKMKFFSRIGFSKNLEEMEMAIKSFRGRGEELYERFECLVQAGLSEEDAAHIIKAAPQILNQSKEVIEAKIRYLVTDLGYPVSSLRPFPGYISYTIERVKLRCLMYKWLVNQNAVRPALALSTIIGCTESYFVNKYVNRHPGGLEIWQELKKTVSL